MKFASESANTSSVCSWAPGLCMWFLSDGTGKWKSYSMSAQDDWLDSEISDAYVEI